MIWGKRPKGGGVCFLQLAKDKLTSSTELSFFNSIIRPTIQPIDV